MVYYPLYYQQISFTWNRFAEELQNSGTSHDNFGTDRLIHYSSLCAALCGLPKRFDSQWKRSKCRKCLYIREGGKNQYLSARTRSWEQAVKLAQAEREKRDPVKIELQNIAEREAAKEAAEALGLVPFGTALDQWLGGMKTQRSASLAAYRSTVRPMKRWADSNGVASLQDVTRKMLDQWRSEWSPEAEAKQNRLALNTQAALLTRIKAFFAWATENEFLERNPALALKAITVNESQTWSLTPEQFEQVPESTRRYDAECRYESARVGQQLRAIFHVQHWTGLGIGDALALPMTALRGNRITLTTQKTDADMECILPDHVVAALTSLPRRP